MKELPAGTEIDKIAENILRDSRSLGFFPTPVQNIIAYTELKLDAGVDLSDIPRSFLARYSQAIRNKIQSAISKILGAIDLREKTIYLNLDQNQNMKRFVQLHETGHHALPWQNEIFCVDNEASLLDPDIKDEFEQEASYFASAILFQLGVFDNELIKLPLSIKSAMILSDKFGASKHASIRRYVERSPKRCALLVLKKPSNNGEFSVSVRNYFQSRPFSEEFGQIRWPKTIGLQYAFVQDLLIGRKYHEGGSFKIVKKNSDLIEFCYHYFNNSYNTFILMFPPGEKIHSRVRIVLA